MQFATRRYEHVVYVNFVESPYYKGINEEGYDVRIICGTRTYMEQDDLSENDKTKARGGQSMHNFGLAWDIGIFQGKKYFTEHELYKILGHLPSNNPDLTWGGSSNYAHYQLNTYGDIESVRQEFEA